MFAGRLVTAGAIFCMMAMIGLAGTDSASKLFGKWEVTKSDEAPPGATIEFAKDGKVKLEAKIKDQVYTIEGTYKLDGKKVTTTLTFGAASKTETNTIEEITDTKLVVSDEKGKTEEYKRVK